MKSLLPSLKQNKRYLLIEAGKKKKAERALKEFLGIFGLAKANPQFIDSDKHTIISINHTSLDEVRTALELSSIKCLRVSGTINKLKKKSGIK